MTAYFDTSAFVKLLIWEPGSAISRQAWQDAGTVASGRLLYAEARAGLAAAHRDRRLTARSHADAKQALQELWDRIYEVDASTVVVRRAGDLAEQEALAGYDAVHLASALRAGAEFFVCADARLIHAASRCGLAVIDARN